jgi:hypothetical protein
MPQTLGDTPASLGSWLQQFFCRQVLKNFHGIIYVVFNLIFK